MACYYHSGGYRYSVKKKINFTFLICLKINVLDYSNAGCQQLNACNPLSFSFFTVIDLPFLKNGLLDPAYSMNYTSIQITNFQFTIHFSSKKS